MFSLSIAGYERELTSCRRFRAWCSSGAEPDIGLPRHHACIMVDRECLESVLDEEKPHEFDAFGAMFVFLVSRYDEYPIGVTEIEVSESGAILSPQETVTEKDDVSYTTVGISFVVPRVYSLLNGPGWQSFADPEGGVFRR